MGGANQGYLDNRREDVCSQWLNDAMSTQQVLMVTRLGGGCGHMI